MHLCWRDGHGIGGSGRSLASRLLRFHDSCLYCLIFAAGAMAYVLGFFLSCNPVFLLPLFLVSIVGWVVDSWFHRYSSVRGN
jgi:hypothetical protein